MLNVNYLCIKMVSNDCKNLQLLYFYVNKPYVERNCMSVQRQIKITNSYVIFIRHMELEV